MASLALFQIRVESGRHQPHEGRTGRGQFQPALLPDEHAIARQAIKLRNRLIERVRATEMRLRQRAETGDSGGNQHRIRQRAGEANGKDMFAQQPLAQNEGILRPDGKDQAETEGKARGEGEWHGSCPVAVGDLTRPGPWRNPVKQHHLG